MSCLPFIGEIPDLVVALRSADVLVTLDLLDMRGNCPFIDRIRFYLDERIIVRVVSKDGWVPFSIGATTNLYVICDEIGYRGAFDDLEEALRFGLSWEFDF